VEYKSVVEKISSTLKNLEEQGELVIISTIPDSIARAIFHSALEAWLEKSGVENDPMECTMQYLLDQTCSEISKRFSINSDQAKNIVNSYYVLWCKTRSIKEIAEIYWHETPSEMAKRAYYCIAMGKSDDRDMDYLDWRKQC
jgi:hypothetical protein